MLYPEDLDDYYEYLDSQTDCSEVTRGRGERLKHWRSRCQALDHCYFSNRHRTCYSLKSDDTSEKETLVPKLKRVMTDKLVDKLDRPELPIVAGYRTNQARIINILLFKNETASGCYPENKRVWRKNNKRVLNFLQVTNKKMWTSIHGKYHDTSEDCQAISLYWCLKPSEEFNVILRNMSDLRYMENQFIINLLTKYYQLDTSNWIDIYTMRIPQFYKFLKSDTYLPPGYCTLLNYQYDIHPSKYKDYPEGTGHTIICGKQLSDGNCYILDPQAIRYNERIICVQQEKRVENLYTNYWVGLDEIKQYWEPNILANAFKQVNVYALFS